MSQLLSRLEKELSSTSDPRLNAELQLEKSCYLSRTGHFSESREIIFNLRKNFGAGQDARVAILIILAEGIADLFQNVGSIAKDRIARAHLLAMAIKDRQLGCLTSAWKAHIEFETSDFSSMISSLQSCFEQSSPQSYEAQSRSAMVLADCFYLCGDRLNGQKWFMQCREIALKAGDQATIDALLYNRAAFGMASLRVDRCFGPVDKELVRLIQLEIASSMNFQSMTRIESLKNLTQLCNARILLLQENFEDAYSALSEVRGAGPFADYNFRESIISLEMVYCLVKAGKDILARELFSHLPELKFPGLDVDDSLVISWIQFELSSISNVYGDAALAKDVLDRSSSEYKVHRNRLHESVIEFSNKFSG